MVFFILIVILIFIHYLDRRILVKYLFDKIKLTTYLMIVKNQFL